MKPFVLFLLFFNFSLICNAQNFQLKIFGSSLIENNVIDSLKYNANHKNAKSVSDEINNVSATLSKIGYFENQILENTRVNDSSFTAKISLGERIKYLHIYIGRKILSPTLSKGEGEETIKNILEIKKDTLILSYGKIEFFLNGTLQKLERKGFALAKLKLINIHKQKQNLYADLQFESGQQRQLNSIVVKYEDRNKKNSFPKGHLAQINRKYHNSTFNQEVVKKIHDDFEKFSFVNQIKYPEILFTKDTTKVYVYLEKRKSNTFDGFIGFANNDNNKLTFNGYLDLALENTLKVGEQFSLYWKSDGNNQKTFKASIEIPYLFKSPIGLKAQLQIFKQDSIFQNTKTSIDLGYLIDYNTRVYLGYQSTESSDIQNTNSATISDYNNSFIAGTLEYSIFDYSNSTFPKKSNLSFIMGIGKRATSNLPETVATSKQFYINLQAAHNFYLNKKNYININYQNYYLKSESYIVNESYRFGGMNSIRGFAENSLQASFLNAIITEYRYIVSSELFLNSILDYAYFQDNSTDLKGTLLGFGMGLGLQTKNGLLRLAIANGSTKNQQIKFYNTIITICYNVKF